MLVQGGTLVSAPGGLTVRTDADATIHSAFFSPAGSTGVFTKTGAGVLTTSSSLSTFSRVIIEAGELNVGNSSFGQITLASIATLTLGFADSTARTFSAAGLSGNGVVQSRLVAGQTATLWLSGTGGSFDGSIRDNAGSRIGLTKSGTGTQELTAANPYSGDTLIYGGTVALTGNGSAVNSALSIYNSTLLLDNSAVSIPDRISDIQSIRLSGVIVLKGNAAGPSTETCDPCRSR